MVKIWWAITWSVEEAGLPAVVGQLLFAVLWLADGGQQLLLFGRVVKVDWVLVYTRSRSDSGELCVVVLDLRPCVLLWRERTQTQNKRILASSCRSEAWTSGKSDSSHVCLWIFRIVSVWKWPDSHLILLFHCDVSVRSTLIERINVHQKFQYHYCS